MSDREINIRSVLFLVIGILLVLSLIICIYIVSNEKDLVKTEAEVIEVNKDNEGSGNNISVIYSVDGENFEYNFRYKDEINVKDKIIIYYHENRNTSVQTYKTSKIIFVCPLIGLVLCGIGLYELFRKNKQEPRPVKNKEQVTETKKEEIPKEVATPEEKIPEIPKVDLKMEPEVSNGPVKAPIFEEASSKPVPTPAVSTQAPKESPTPAPVTRPTPTPAPAPKPNAVVTPDKLPVKKVEPTPKPEPVAKLEAAPSVPKPEPIKESKQAPSVDVSNMKSLDEVTAKVRESVSKNISSDASEDDIKNVIKEVLKEVIKEVKEEEKPVTEVVQKRVIPNYFYISGTSLIYEEMGKKAVELNLKDIKRVVRTINSAGSVVKLVVSNDEYKIVLTNMKNIDLEQLANLLHNKMRTIDDTFKEIIERKEY